MSNLAIKVVDLGKQYRIGRVSDQAYRTLRDNIADMAASPFRKAYQLLRGDRYAALVERSETLWALRDINLEVEKGEVLGVIGHNGAGKSTLLKILSRITEPSTGYVDLYGRVGSLLEVGTGFHQELTGRENIYLNGSILGMPRAEIARKFDEIVSFSGVEKFIDTPVKHYSSGMHLRLGFSVAAHLEPDILLVDEVLAVGDAEFQKKCLGKMSSVASEGRTVLFVSHNMSAVTSLCSKAYWLQRGRIRAYGAAPEIVKQYLGGSQSKKVSLDLSESPRLQSESRIIQRLEFLHLESASAIYTTNSRFGFAVTCQLDPAVAEHFSLGFAVLDVSGAHVFSSHFNQYQDYSVEAAGTVTFRAEINPLSLTPGTYFLSIYGVSSSYNIDIVENAASFDIVWDTSLGLKYPPGEGWGGTFVPVEWSVIE